MKTLGLIGGLSWYSTVLYYQTINQSIQDLTQGEHTAKLLLHSLDFHDFRPLQNANSLDAMATLLVNIGINLQKAGADCIIICSNTPHLVADHIEQKLNIPLLHIATETAKEISLNQISKVGLLGTKLTMEQEFFKAKLVKQNIEVLIPESQDRNFIHSSIIDELTKGVFLQETRIRYLEIIELLIANGCQGIVFGCTEIGLLIDPKNCPTKIFDTSIIHCKAAVDFALSK
ncbi:MAG: aspartate/glutamate racemase family protein [Saprospiraceae bacterium]|nr:aspartate/glutamate racemase family protein [Saprospiraceae bacterium]